MDYGLPALDTAGDTGTAVDPTESIPQGGEIAAPRTNDLSPAAQAQVEAARKQMQADYTRKTQALAQERREMAEMKVQLQEMQRKLSDMTRRPQAQPAPQEPEKLAELHEELQGLGLEEFVMARIQKMIDPLRQAIRPLAATMYDMMQTQHVTTQLKGLGEDMSKQELTDSTIEVMRQFPGIEAKEAVLIARRRLEQANPPAQPDPEPAPGQPPAAAPDKGSANLDLMARKAALSEPPPISAGQAKAPPILYEKDRDAVAAAVDETTRTLGTPDDFGSWGGTPAP